MERLSQRRHSAVVAGKLTFPEVDKGSQNKWPGTDGCNSIAIVPSQASYCGGDTVGGWVCIHVTKPCKVGELKVQLEIYETVDWTEKKLLNNDAVIAECPDDMPSGLKRQSSTTGVVLEEKDVSFSGGRRIIRPIVQIAVEVDELQPGRYQYMFDFGELPSGLPSTMEEFMTGSADKTPGDKSGKSSLKKCRAKIVMKIKAGASSTPQLRAKHKVALQSSINDLTRHTYSTLGSEVIDSCVHSKGCGVAKGKSILSGSLERSVVMPGDKISCQLTIVNKSHVPIDVVFLKLCRTVTYKGSGMNDFITRRQVIFSDSFTDAVLPKSVMERKIHYLHVPKRAPPTVDGRQSHHIVSDYHIEVTSSGLHIKLPVVIGSSASLTPIPLWVKEVFPELEIQEAPRALSVPTRNSLPPVLSLSDLTITTAVQPNDGGATKPLEVGASIQEEHVEEGMQSNEDLRGRALSVEEMNQDIGYVMANMMPTDIQRYRESNASERPPDVDLGLLMGSMLGQTPGHGGSISQPATVGLSPRPSFVGETPGAAQVDAGQVSLNQQAQPANPDLLSLMASMYAPQSAQQPQPPPADAPPTSAAGIVSSPPAGDIGMMMASMIAPPTPTQER